MTSPRTVEGAECESGGGEVDIPTQTGGEFARDEMSRPYWPYWALYLLPISPDNLVHTCI